MNHISVIDSPVGSGKTSWAINYINASNPEEKFFVITPLLSEVQRFKVSCPDRHFEDPKTGDSNKFTHLLNMVSQGKNIVSTHALLQQTDDELITLLRASEYTLILDESFQVVSNFTLYKSSETKNEEEQLSLTLRDIDWLLKDDYIRVDETYLVHWKNKGRVVGNKYSLLYNMIEKELLYMVRGKCFMWAFPHHLFVSGIFKKIFILTYLFKSQFQNYYFDYFNLPYDTYHIEKIYGEYSLVETVNNNHELEFKKKAKELITIVEHSKLNSIGGYENSSIGRAKKTALSMNWYKKNPLVLRRLNSHLLNYFKHVTSSSPEDRLWTTFKDFKGKLKNGAATEKTFLSFTAKATNDYRNRSVLAFMINRYPSRFYVEFFAQKGITVNDDLYALSDLIQWVWRSAIRDGKPITLYLPSERMRDILRRFLDNEEIESAQLDLSSPDYEED